MSSLSALTQMPALTQMLQLLAAVSDKSNMCKANTSLG